MAGDLPEKIDWDKAWVDCDSQDEDEEIVVSNHTLNCVLSLICWFILSILSGDLYLITCSIMTLVMIIFGVRDEPPPNEIKEAIDVEL
jgi:hypothetical protein